MRVGIMFTATGVSRLMRLVAEEATETMVDCVQRLSSPVHSLQGSLNPHKPMSSLSSADSSSTSSLPRSSSTSSSSSSVDDCFEIDDDADRKTKAGSTNRLDELFLTVTSCEAARVNTVLASLNANEDILAYEDKDHYNIFQKAIILNQKELFHTLIEHGCDVNYTSAGTCNISSKCRHANLGLLHLACLLGRLDFVETLISHGADVNAKRCVYTSSMVNCPAHLQPKMLSCGLPSPALELVHRCGAREPAFFAVLGDHRDVLHHLFNIIRPLDDPTCHSFLPLACRSGSTNCLEYLIQLFPHTVDCPDSDGLPPLLMAMKHGLAPLRVLLENGARATVLNNHWKPGNNILHFLFRSLPFLDVEKESLLDVLHLCLEQNIDISSLNEETQEMPLHYLVASLNVFCKFDVNNPSRNDKATLLTQSKSDGDIMKCIEFLLNRPDVDVNVSDHKGRTLLHYLCSNHHHITRFKLYQSGGLDPEVRMLMRGNAFGLDNLVGVLQLILQHGAMPKADCNWSTPLNTLLMTLVKDHTSSEARGGQDTPHSLQILTHDDVFRDYRFLIGVLVEKGNDINSAPSGSLPPLLYILSRLQTGSVEPEMASPLRDLMVELLELGAWTEYDSCYDGETLEKRHIGAFDILLETLCTLTNRSNDETADLSIVIQFTIPLLQYGAKTVVYGDLLYGHSDASAHPEPAMCHHLPEHSYLYQLLQLGALNLHIASQTTHFWPLCDLLLGAADHNNFYEVVNCLRTQFEAMHDPDMCACGQCDDFSDYLITHSSSPRPLQQITRKAIVSAIRGVCPRLVSSLPLPESLIDFLLHRK